MTPAAVPPPATSTPPPIRACFRVKRRPPPDGAAGLSATAASLLEYCNAASVRRIFPALAATDGSAADGSRADGTGDECLLARELTVGHFVSPHSRRGALQRLRAGGQIKGRRLPRGA